jgi:hypothetical protein
MNIVIPKLDLPPVEQMLEELKKDNGQDFSKKGKMSQSFRNVCFTAFTKNVQVFLNNYNPHKQIKYIVFQLERCPNTGREHIQGYAEFKDSYKKSTIQNYLGCDNSLHIEERIGTQDQAIHYCVKPEEGCECEHCINNANGRLAGPWEFGVKKRDNSSKKPKGNLNKAIAMIKNKKPLSQIANDLPDTIVRNYNGLRQLQNSLIQRRNFKTRVSILWGDSNVGKTKLAYTIYNPDQIYKLMSPKNDSLWWDGYDPYSHVCILIDEFYGWIKLNELLNLWDEYPHRVESKGSSIEFVATHIILTSNKPPESWYKSFFNKKAFVRRINECFHVTGSNHHDANWNNDLARLQSWADIPDPCVNDQDDRNYKIVSATDRDSFLAEYNNYLNK